MIWNKHDYHHGMIIANDTDQPCHLMSTIEYIGSQTNGIFMIVLYQRKLKAMPLEMVKSKSDSKSVEIQTLTSLACHSKVYCINYYLALGPSSTQAPFHLIDVRLPKCAQFKGEVPINVKKTDRIG